MKPEQPERDGYQPQDASFGQEDYTDPVCPFDTSMFEKEPPVRSVPVSRIIEKEDSLLAAKDWDGAERLLKYWEKEAEEGRDGSGLFVIMNELMGLYRKTGRKEKAENAAAAALQLIPAVGARSTAAATALVNAATVYKSFGRPEEAVPLFEKARRLYEELLPPSDPRQAGLLNNMALALTDLERYGEAEALYKKAIGLLEEAGQDLPEQAVSWLNLADLYYLRDGAEESEEAVERCLDEAERLLEDPSNPRNGNYAFVCEKCAPSFEYYGRFFYAKELTERAEQIYREHGSRE